MAETVPDTCKRMEQQSESGKCYSLEAMRAALQRIQCRLQTRDETKTCKKHYLRLESIRHTFTKYHEVTTPKSALSLEYGCVARIKSYPADKMMYMYLELYEKSGESPWPVKAFWKIDLVDENDPDNKDKTFPLGQTTIFFNKPRQGLASHSNDWISVQLDRLEHSGRIAPDGSVTLKFSVVTEPVLLDVYIQQCEELLRLAEICISNNVRRFDFENVEEKLNLVVNKVEEHSNKLSSLDENVFQLNNQLLSLEKNQVSIDGKLHKLTQELDNFKRTLMPPHGKIQKFY